MQTENLIPVNEFCISHDIEISFITSLQQYGMIEITTINKVGFIDMEQLRQLEKFINLYYELDINLEGIETIDYLLQKISSMQSEIVELRNRLRLYEADE